MENFFLNLNCFDELKLTLFKKYKDEKIFLSTKNFNLELELSKNHAIEKNEKNIGGESVKAYVIDFNNVLYQKISSVSNCSVYIIFNSLFDLLNFNGRGKMFFCVLDPKCALNEFSAIRKCMLDFCQKLLFSLSHSLFECLFNKKEFYSSKFILELIIKCINFFKLNNRISFYNYFEFSILVKKLLEVKQILNFEFFEKICAGYGLLSSSQIDENKIGFLLIWLEKEFLKSKTFFKLFPKSFSKRLEDVGFLFENCDGFAGFNFDKTDETVCAIKTNFAFFEKEIEKMFLLSEKCLTNKRSNKNSLSGKLFLKSVSFACDAQNYNIFQFMKNLGFLNAV